ncbi:MAG: hypothetical protein DHS20C08_07620 [Rhodomicrobium sp.]|nr:MAG: hypothetical protein DHS20C08_07620 [Rhodomicrobium sp.]
MQRLTFHIAVFLLTGLIAFAGFDRIIDNKISEYRFELLPQMASGEIVFIAIDHKSISTLKKWPWPRSTHAKLIKSLREYKVSEIAFDIDFSSETSVSEDNALRDALENADGSVILPTFRQTQKHLNGKETIVHNTPLKKFQEHSWLASVNIYPSRNGKIDSMPYGHKINDEFIPSLSALLTGVYKPSSNDFIIDYGIRSNSIPTYSYIDVLKKTVNPNLLQGRKVVIGASSTELGDKIFIPGQGIVAGPLLQILGAETIIQNRELKELSQISVWIGILLLAVFIALQPKTYSIISKLSLFAVLSITMELIALTAYHYNGLMINTALWHIALVGFLTATLINEIDLFKLMKIITEGKLSETQQIFEQVFNDSYTGAIVANDDGTIRAASNAVTNILKTPEGVTLEGNHYRHYLPETIAIAADHLLKETDHSQGLINQSGKTEFKVDPENDDSTIMLEYTITLSPLPQDKSKPDQQRRIITFAIQDITNRHQAEQAQKAAADAAIQSDKAKTDFLANISHELRTPLNSILGFSEIIEQQALGPDKLDQYSEFAGDIKTSGQQLLRVVNDIIHLTRVESGEFTMNEEDCDVIDIIEYAVEDVSVIFRGHTLNIAVESDDNLPSLRADSKICHEIMTAIISNAIKFSDDNEEIMIRAIKNREGELCISVQDHGTGISRSELNNIFKPFYQIESDKNRQFEGTGLGLTKANAYMRSLKGTLKVASSLGEGTTIYLTFPARRCFAKKETVISLAQGPDDFRISA